MITLFRERDSKEADEIQSRLEGMIAAHEVRSAEEFDGAQKELPVIDDSGDRYSGADIDLFLRTLEREIRITRQISADACYVDPDSGETC